MLRIISVVMAAMLVVGCGGGSNVKQAAESPLVRGESKFAIDNLKVNLTFGHGNKPELNLFADEEQLNQHFKEALVRHMRERGIFADEASNADADLQISIAYKRNFNVGGKALNKPAVSHAVNVVRDGAKLASLSQSNYQPKYGFLKQAAVDVQITTFSWGAEDELKDVNLIAKLIVEDVAKLGRKP